MTKKHLFICLLLLNGSLHASSEEPANWHWDPKEYEDSSQKHKLLVFQILDKIPWRGDEVVLDVGTADGGICSYIASKIPGGLAICTDFTKEMIDYAKERYPQKIYPNIQFEVGNAITYQSDKRFDIITGFNVLHLISDQAKAIKNLASMLKDNGCMLFQTAIEDEFYRTVNQLINSPKWKEYFIHFVSGWYYHTEEEYKKFLVQAGINSFYIEIGGEAETFSTKEGFYHFLHSWVPHLKVLPLQEHPVFLDELISLYLEKRPPDPKTGNIIYDESYLLIRAYR